MFTGTVIFLRVLQPHTTWSSHSWRSKLLAHHIQLLMDQNPESSVLKTDVSNVFNSISRECLMEEISKHFPRIVAHVHQMYSKRSSLIHTKNQSDVTIQSDKGIHQGDPLGPALCYSNPSKSPFATAATSYCNHLCLS